MGNACPAFRDSPPPNAIFPNKNICTIYKNNDISQGLESISAIAPLYAMKNAIDRETSAIDGSDYPSNYVVVEDFCLNPGKEMDMLGQGENYCHDIGGNENNHEWKAVAYFDDGNRDKLWQSCKYSSAGVTGHRIHIGGAGGCCRGDCVFEGGHMGVCKRNSYTGDKATCCFRDFNCKNFGGTYKDIQSCYSDTKQRLTCDPNYRDLKSDNCKAIVADYCLGKQFFPAQTDWMELWLPDSVVNISMDPDNEEIMVKAPCLMAVMRNLFGKAADGICDYDTLSNIKLEGFNDSGNLWSVEIINEVFTRYIQKFGNPLKGINQDGYIKSAAFFNFMFNFCKQYPSLCTDFLKNQLCINTTQDQVMNDTQTNNWCGCYMPDSEYEKYNQYGIDKECTPFCNQKDTIKLANVDGTEKICTQTSCIINDAIITALNDRFPDGFNFSQVCHSCGQNSVAERLSRDNSDIKSNNNGGVVLNTGPNLFYQYNLTSQDEYFLKENVLYVVSSLAEVQGAFPYSSEILPNSESDWNGPDLVDYSLKNLNVAPVVQFTIKCEPDNADYFHDDSNGVTVPSNTRCYVTDFKIINEGDVDIDKLKLMPGSIIGLKYQLEGNITSTNSAKTIYDNWDRKTVIEIPTSGTNARPAFNFALDPSTNINNRKNSYALTNIFFTNQINNQEIRNNVTEYNKEAASNTCFCIMDGTTINITNSKVGNLNLVQNCGQVSCHDNSGKMIPCDNGGNNLDDNSYLSDNDSFSTYKTEEKKKVDLVVILVLFAIFIILVMIRTVQTYFNPKIKKTKDKI